MKKEHFVPGWIRQKKDHRDHQYKARAIKVPSSFKSANIGAVKDQGQLGSCTGHGGTTATEIVSKKEGKTIVLSPMYLYWFTRFLEGTTSTDAGAEVRDVFKAGKQFGIAPETAWSYLIRQFKTRPSKTACLAALVFKDLQYEAVAQDINIIKNAIVTNENVIIGFDVYDNFFDIGMDGTMPAPAGNLAGGHCVCIYGYDDVRNAVLCRNSWGDAWGQNGDFWMPYSYLLSQHAADFWTVSLVGK